MMRRLLKLGAFGFWLRLETARLPMKPYHIVRPERAQALRRRLMRCIRRRLREFRAAFESPTECHEHR